MPRPPDPIFEALTGYRVAAAMRSALELDYFSAVAEGRATAAAVAASRGGTERSARILLDAVAAAVPSALRKKGARYALTPLARKFLVRSSPAFLGPLAGLVGHSAMWDAYRELTAAVRAGTSVMGRNAHAPGQEFWEEFARATAHDAGPKARAVLRALGRLPRGCEVLDLACGSGTYGAAFARAVPGARVTLFDQPHVLAVTRKLVDAPVRYLAGDLFATPFGGPYDVVVASHVFHHFDRGECLRLARKVAGALKPGGRLAIQEFVPDEGRARKALPILFALTMLVWTRSGDAYTLSDYRGWLRVAGLANVVYRPLDLPGDLILARKP